MTKSRTKLLYSLAFFLPALLMLGVYAAMGMAPFGDKTILAMDMADQYVEFFCALKNGDIYFSWSKALGSSYIGVFSYYVSSPLSLLTLLVPNEHMPIGLMFLTVLKVGLSGLTYAVFSHRFFRHMGSSTLMGALAYSLCSYAAAYSMCIMWLDGMIWLPLILLGLERLLEGRSAVFFAAALTACFISGWYISYMVGAFCLLWFIFRSICLKPSLSGLLRSFGRFLLSAIWALFASAWLWLPSFLSMFSGKLTDSVMDYSTLTNFGMRFILQFLPGQYNSLTGTALPFVFCGVLTPLFFISWLFCRKFPLRERLGSLALAIALLMSLWLAPLDKIWHLFKFPNWFPYRYTFLLSFLLVLFAQKMLIHLLQDRISPRPAAVVSLCLTVVLCIELGANTHIILNGVDKQFRYESYSAYHDYYTANEELLSHTEEDGFYRVGAAKDRGFNSPLSFGYPGITHYSSVYNKRVNAALKSLGFAQSWMWSAYYGSTPFTDALFGIRYVLDSENGCGYEQVASTNDLTLWENPTALPLVFSADAQVLSAEGNTPFALQNALFSALGGTEQPLFSPIVPTVNDSETGSVLTFVGNGQPIYADLSSGGMTELKINGGHQCWLSLSEEQRIHYLGTPAPGEIMTAEISWQTQRSWNNKFFTCDISLLNESLAGIQSEVLVSRRRVEASVTTLEGQVILTTVPHEAGWTVRVDGEKVSASSFMDAFIAIPVNAGTHTVTMQYTPPGLYPSLALAFIALLWAAGVLVYGGRKRRQISGI